MDIANSFAAFQIKRILFGRVVFIYARGSSLGLSHMNIVFIRVKGAMD